MDWAVMFSAGIFLLSFLSFLLVGINLLLNAKIRPIENQLSNHVTDTGKKIDKVAEDTGKKIDKVAEDTGKKIDKVAEDTNKKIAAVAEDTTDLKIGQTRLEAKLDQILKDKK